MKPETTDLFIAACEVSESGFRANAPAKASSIQRSMSDDFSPAVSSDLESMWSRFDGGTFSDLYIMGTDEAYLYGKELFAFHNWGNGDFDCVAVKGDSVGAVFFTNHQSNARSKIADSLDDWFVLITKELKKHGVVYHPKDYLLNNAQHDGLYSSAVENLSAMNCELTRWKKMQDVC